jgi:hypothetical protein
MGSYNVSCGVSRISIHPGDRICLIPLVPNRGEKLVQELINTSYIVSNDGPKALFSPFTLPIFGVYGDYGRIEEIERTKHVEAIEKYFECDIQDFANAITCGSGKKTDKLPSKIAGMFVLRDVYEELVKNEMNEYEEKTTAYNDGYVYDYLLEVIGFTKGDKDENRKRYNIPFTHTKIPGLTIWSDGTWVEIDINGKKEPSWIYNLEDLVQFLQKHKFYIPEEIEEFKNISSYNMLYEKELKTIEERIKSTNIIAAHYEAMGEKMTEAEKFRRLGFDLNHSIFKFGTWATEIEDLCYLMYSSLFYDVEFKREFIEFNIFQHMLYYVNAPYMPSWNGLQWGNDKGKLVLINCCKRILEERIKESAKYEGESDIDT